MTNHWDNMASLVISQTCQVTVVILFVAIVVRLCCRQRPHLAYLLWMLVLVKCLTPPIWSSPVGLFSWAQVQVDVVDGQPDQLAPIVTETVVLVWLLNLLVGGLFVRVPTDSPTFVCGNCSQSLSLVSALGPEEARE